MGLMLSFFEFFPFFQMGSKPWAFAGLVAFAGICVFKAILVPQLGCPYLWHPTVAPEALVESMDSAKGCFCDFSLLT